jgi:hypothetical protein
MTDFVLAHPLLHGGRDDLADGGKQDLQLPPLCGHAHARSGHDPSGCVIA